VFLVDFLPPRPNPLWALARQMGITHCVVKAAPEMTGLAPPYEPGVLARIQADLADAGLILIGLEGDPFDMSRIKLGQPGCAEDLDHYTAMLQEMGRLKLRLLCYNFMGGIGWHRSNTSVHGRGGALVSSFELHDEPKSLSAAGEIPPEAMWSNYTRFIAAIIPSPARPGFGSGRIPTTRHCRRYGASPGY